MSPEETTAAPGVSGSKHQWGTFKFREWRAGDVQPGVHVSVCECVLGLIRGFSNISNSNSDESHCSWEDMCMRV